MAKKEKRYSDDLEYCSKDELLRMIREYGGYRTFIYKYREYINQTKKFAIAKKEIDDIENKIDYKNMEKYSCFIGRIDDE